MDHNSLEVNTLDPLPGWPRVRQVAVSVGRAGQYWFEAADRAEHLAVVQLGIRGVGRVHTSGGDLLVQPGHVMLMRTGIDRLGYGLHVGDAAWHFAYAEIAGDLALQAMGTLIARHGHVFNPGSGDLRELLSGLAARPGIHHAVWDVSASARTAGAILAAVAHTTATAEGDLTRRAIALFEQRLAGSISVAAAAAQLGVGRERLSRAFHASLGVPPATWLRQRRLDLARQLLQATGAQVQDVAGRVGYRSVAQFLRAYAARYGHTPGGRRVRR
jgi:AraC-like DNA-binding protein